MRVASVLLVEDDENDVLLIKRAFQKSHVVNLIQVVSDGEVAVAYLSGEGIYGDRARYPFPVAMLLDLKLPRKSGLEVLGWAKQQPELKRLPIIVLTSSREARDIKDAYACYAAFASDLFSDATGIAATAALCFVRGSRRAELRIKVNSEAT